MKSAVEFKNVSKRYELGTGQTSIKRLVTKPLKKMFGRQTSLPPNQILWALRDVNFAVQPGRALGLVGPNGSGKTTSLKLLSKITFPSSGDIKVDGRISALIELGAGFHPDLTGRENVYLNGTILGMSRQDIDKQFDRIVAFSELERFIDTPVKRYSSGMYVRLGFAVAAHVEPDVLLVDEVLAVGDAQFRQKCARRIEELQNMGTTIVFVAHNLYLVRSVCDEAVFLLNGVVQQTGEVDEVLSAYETWLFEQQVEKGQAQSMSSEMGSGSKDVAITGIEIINKKSGSLEAFEHHDPAEIRIYYQAEKPVPQPNAVIRIRRADGATAAMIRTADYGHSLATLEGEGYISVLIDPLQLASGAFQLHVTLLGAVDGVGLAWGDSRWFQATGLSLAFEETGGIFVPRLTKAFVEPGQGIKPVVQTLS